jgi:hypothetical protein
LVEFSKRLHFKPVPMRRCGWHWCLGDRDHEHGCEHLYLGCRKGLEPGWNQNDISRLMQAAPQYRGAVGQNRKPSSVRAV